MSTFTIFALPNWLLIDLADIAIGVSLACVASIVISLVARRLVNPVRHALLVSALVVSISCPLLIATAQRFEWSLVRIAAIETTTKGSEIVSSQDLGSGESPQRTMPRQEGNAQIASMATPPEYRPSGVPANQGMGIQRSSPPAAVQFADSASWGISWLAIASLAAWVWAIGIFLTLVRAMRGALFVRRFSRTCVPVTEERLLNAMCCAEKRVQLWRPVPLHVSAFTLTPLVIGLWNPRVVVPNGMECELDDDQLVDVFTHELAHLKRHDHWVGVLQRVATVFYWWNPLITCVNYLIGDVRERICDDVASQPSAEHRYARALVKLAELVIDQPRIPAAIGILSFKQNHLRFRISRLLEAERSRDTAVGFRGWLAVLLATGVVSCLIMLSALTVPVTSVVANEPQAAPQKEADKKPGKGADTQAKKGKPPFRFPAQVTGSILTEDGKPIPRAAVTFEFGIAQKNQGTPSKPSRRMQLTTDDQGKYVVDTRDFPAIEEAGFDIFLYALADGFAEGTSGMWYSADEAPVVKLAEVKLPAGRVVRGRVQGIAGNVPDQIILHAMANIDRGNVWRSRPVAVGADGAFALSVPKSVDAELMIVSGNFAPLSITVALGTTQLDTLTLPTGTSLTGRVLDRAGDPVAGCVVVATEKMERQFPAYRATKTNARGEYRIAPLRGDFQVHLAEFASTSDRIEGSELESDKKPPSVAPIKITLNGEAREQQLNIQAGPTLTVRGIVRWADGRPAVKCEMTAWSNSVLLDRLTTGADGSYTMQLPKPITDIAISAIGLLDEKRDFHIAYPVCEAPAREKNSQFLVFDRLEQDLNDANWELRRFEAATPAKTDAGSDELSRLRQKYEEQTKVYQEAEKAAKTPEDELQVYRTQDPRNVIGPELLALEAKYRGQPTGVEAFTWLFRMTCSVGMPDIPVAKARETALDILFEHYLNHPDLDAFLAQFEAGPRAKRGEELLRAALKSPHRNVRAAATYRLASYRWSHAFSPDQYQPMFDILSDDPNIARQIEHAKASLREYQGVDAEKARAEAEQLAEQVRKDYADLGPPQQDYWTYGELAESLLFEMKYLRTGKIAPEIQGIDAQGNPVHLTKLRGKFVLVSFTYSAPHDFQHLRQLSKKYSSDKVAIINIASYAKIDEITEQIRSGEITWPVIVDAQFGPITRRWNVDGFPRNYVIDPAGVIRGVDTPTDWLDSFLGRVMVKK